MTNPDVTNIELKSRIDDLESKLAIVKADNVGLLTKLTKMECKEAQIIYRNADVPEMEARIEQLTQDCANATLTLERHHHDAAARHQTELEELRREMSAQIAKSDMQNKRKNAIFVEGKVEAAVAAERREKEAALDRANQAEQRQSNLKAELGKLHEELTAAKHDQEQAEQLYFSLKNSSKENLLEETIQTLRWEVAQNHAKMESLKSELSQCNSDHQQELATLKSELSQCNSDYQQELATLKSELSLRNSHHQQELARLKAETEKAQTVCGP